MKHSRRFLILRPDEWAGLPHGGWWAVTDKTQIIALFRTQTDASTFATTKERQLKLNNLGGRVVMPNSLLTGDLRLRANRRRCDVGDAG